MFTLLVLIYFLSVSIFIMDCVANLNRVILKYRNGLSVKIAKMTEEDRKLFRYYLFRMCAGFIVAILLLFGIHYFNQLVLIPNRWN